MNNLTPDQQEVAATLRPQDVTEILSIGRRVVKHNLDHQSFLVNSGDNLTDSQFEAARTLAQLGVEREVRSDSTLYAPLVTENKLTNFAAAIEELRPPPFLMQSLNVTTHQELAKKVVGAPETITQALSVANFYEWYNHAFDNRAEEFKRDEAPKLLDKVDDHLKEGAASQILPAKALRRFRQLRKKDKLHIGIFGNPLVGHEGQIGHALHFANGDELMHLSLELKGAELEHTATHEALHTIEGASEPGDPDAQGVDPTKARGLYRLFGNGPLGKIIGEAVVEHTADSLINGNFEVTLPVAAARKGSRSYTGSRLFWHVLSNCGVKPIHPSVFVNALFEDGTIEDGPSLQRLQQELRDAFPGQDIVKELKAELKSSNDTDAIYATGSFYRKYARTALVIEE